MPPKKSENVVIEVSCCTICAEPYTAVVRKRVECNSCHKDVCTKCVERYLLSTIEDPHCLHCRASWPRSFLSSICSMTFLNKTYYVHRQEVLVNREKSFLPTYQPVAAREVRAREISKEDQAVADEYYRVEKAMNKKLAELSKIRSAIWRRVQNVRAGLEENAAAGEKAKAVVSKFVRRCTAPDCKGFLSSAWKCGLCSSWACPDCFEIKGLVHDAPHTCTADGLATAALIRKDTKPCPTCGEMISKIDGCYAAETPVLSWNGQVILAKDIKIGDVLIGDDGTPRTVQTLCSGEDDLYEVSQTNGMTYTVNSKHKLALKFSGDRVMYWSESDSSWKMRWFDPVALTMKSKKITAGPDCSKDRAKELLEEFRSTLEFPEVIEMVVDDYMRLPPSITKNLMGFKSQGVSWPTVPVEIDPYLVGLYIGDGIHTGEAFAINAKQDPEILEYLLNWCDSNHAELCHEAAYKFSIRGRGRGLGRKAIGHGATSADCSACHDTPCSLCDLPDTPYTDTVERARSNPLKTLLAKYDLVRNKHIPANYMMNDRPTRLAVLAGLIDTDGYLSNDGKRISISQSKEAIGEQIEFLAMSLGFTVTTRRLEKKGISINGSAVKDYADHYGINISGTALHEIPTRVLRKKCVASTPNKDYLRTGIQVKPIGKGTYYGWSIDGNKRFVLEDFTVGRNCDQMWCISCHTPFSWATGHAIKTGIVHNPHYFQWLAKGGQAAPQNPGFIPCGGLPNGFQVQTALASANKEDRKEIMDILRICGHMSDVERHRYERHLDPLNNEDVGVQYLLKESSEENWKQTLAKREKERQKSNEIRDILDAFNGAAIDLFRRIDLNKAPKYDREEATKLIMELRVELEELRKFTFTAMSDVGKSFNCSVPWINDKWEVIHGTERTRKKKEEEAEAREAQRAKDEAERKRVLDMAAETIRKESEERMRLQTERLAREGSASNSAAATNTNPK
jgi:hypothetical protein